MKTVRVERSIAAPAADVFEMLTDHAGYTRFRGVSKAERFRDGEPDPNGVGAMRRITTPPVTFEEEILTFDRPRRMDYVIRKANFPLEHEGGSIVVEGALARPRRVDLDVRGPDPLRLRPGIRDRRVRGQDRLLAHARRRGQASRRG